MFTGTMNSDFYIKILDEWLLPYIKDVFAGKIHAIQWSQVRVMPSSVEDNDVN